MRKQFIFTIIGFASAMPMSAFGDEPYPVEYVRVCDKYGTNYYYSPGTETCINANTGVTKTDTENGTVTGKTALAQQLEYAQNRVERAFEQASIGAALMSPDLVAGEHFGVRVNWGNAGGSNAMGITGAAVLGEGLFATGGRLTGTAGIAFAGKTVGGNAGVQLTWWSIEAQVEKAATIE